MTHPEVQERVSRARRVADAIAAVAYATGAADEMAAGFSEGSGVDLKPSQAITYVVTMYYGGLATASGRARLGDVRFAQQMLPFDRNLEDDNVAAAALHRYVGYPGRDDLQLIIDELLRMPDARLALPPGVDLEQDLQELANQARAPWADASLNVTVDPAPRHSPQSSGTTHGKAGPSRDAVALVLALAACLLALAIFYLLTVIFR